MLTHMLEVLLGVYGVGSWCMCFYVFFSCGEGIYWFTTCNNYLLILGATCAAAASTFWTFPSASLTITFTGWSFYAMLVTAHYWRFKLWRRHIIPVNAVLLYLFCWQAYRQLHPSIHPSMSSS